MVKEHEKRLAVRFFEESNLGEELRRASGYFEYPLRKIPPWAGSRKHIRPPPKEGKCFYRYVIGHFDTVLMSYDSGMGSNGSVRLTSKNLQVDAEIVELFNKLYPSLRERYLSAPAGI